MLWEDGGGVLIGGGSTAESADCRRFELCSTLPVLVRVGPGGALDPSFGSGGVVSFPGLVGTLVSDRYGSGVEALAARLAGGIFAAGSGSSAAFVAALAADGSLVPSFGGSGLVTEHEPLPSSTKAQALAVDGSGGLLVGGETSAGLEGISSTVGAVFRYLPDGQLDSSFGVGGFAQSPGSPVAVLPAPDGAIFVLAGTVRATVTKLTAAGRSETGFGVGGTESIDTPKSFRPNAIALLPDGELLVAGMLASEAPAVARLRADGSPNRSFGRNGVAVVRPGRGRDWTERGMLVEPDGRILLAGSSHRSHARCCPQGSVAVIRLLPGGGLDRGFGQGGSVVVPHRGEGTGLALRGRRILVAGIDVSEGKGKSLLLRLGRAGDLDRRFARDGFAQVPVRPENGVGNGYVSAAVIPVGGHLLLNQVGSNQPVTVLDRNGRPQRGSTLPRTRLGDRDLDYPSGLATLSGNRLVLAWTRTRKIPGHHLYRDQVVLRRILLG